MTAEKPPTSTNSRSVELPPSRSNPVRIKFCKYTGFVVPCSWNANVKSTKPEAVNPMLGSKSGGLSLLSKVKSFTLLVLVRVTLQSTMLPPNLPILV